MKVTLGDGCTRVRIGPIVMAHPTLTATWPFACVIQQGKKRPPGIHLHCDATAARQRCLAHAMKNVSALLVLLEAAPEAHMRWLAAQALCRQLASYGTFLMQKHWISTGLRRILRGPAMGFCSASCFRYLTLLLSLSDALAFVI